MTCPVCSTTTLPAAHFCHACGAALGAARGPEASPDPAARDGLDRRVVTVLVADLVGYSGFVAACDPEEVRRRMDDLFSRLAACVDRFGGSVEKFIGDAVFAVFGSPIAHDDDALRAVTCARAMREVARAGWRDGGGRAATEPSRSPSEPSRSPSDDADRVQLRIGLATGEVVAGRRSLAGRTDWAITGLPAALATRIAELAGPGEILLDPQTARAARHRIDVEVTDRVVVLPGRPRLGLLRFVGLRSPLGFAAVGPALIGRWRERERLRAALDAVARTGRGRVVLVVGEAGIGKSRLLADLEADARAAGFRWTWTENLSYRSTEPYAGARTFVEAVATELGLDAGTVARQLVLGDGLDPARERRYAGAIAVLAREAGIEGWETELALAPADPALVAATLLEVGTRFVRRLAELEGPRVVVLDDLHWADPSSRPITDHLIAACPELPFLVLATTRPGPLPAWVGLPHVEVIDLAGLDVSETERFVEALVGVDLSAADAARLRERTDGNPLFIIEVVRSLLDDGAARVEDGRLVVDPVRLGTGVPLTLRAMVGARLDTLEPEERNLLEVAAVVGMSFDLPTLEALLRRPVAEAELLRLGRAGFVTPAGSTGRWRFAHPVVHEATHARMVTSRRATLHARLADHLEATIPSPPVSQLALHRAIARDPRAVPLLARAADEAMAAGAVVEAAGFFRTAAELAADPAAADRFRHLAALALSGVGSGGSEQPHGASA
ncbi:MAG TPA: AAA family ATPase [Candidatus Binatia bacterium]|nr:AAA family ATPase [Candidatus Binatia bacterium]